MVRLGRMARATPQVGYWKLRDGAGEKAVERRRK
jgi:hypothetical protein